MKFNLRCFLLLIISIFIVQAQDFNEGPYGTGYFDIAGPFTISDLNSTLSGDLNFDETVNIQDIILEISYIIGTLNNIESAMTDSFPMDLLDHPHYTNPRIIEEMKVPDVLISGNHKKIDEWRYDQRIIRTKKNRYDLWEKYKNNKNRIGELNNE